MIAVVVLTYSAPPGMLEDCVESVVASVMTAGGTRMYVVDNGSSAAARLDARSDFVGCELIVTGSNRGFAGGMNVGIERALADGAAIVVLLNDDVVVEPDWLGGLLAAFGDGRSPSIDDAHADGRGGGREKIGAVQPMLLAAGSEPPLVNSLGVQLGPDGAGRDIGIGEAPPTDLSVRSIELFTGGAVALSAAFLRDVGMFDERYFLYYEDVDLGLRGASRGWTYRCAPASRVWHRGSVSTSRRPTRTAYLRERNRLWILVRHRGIGDIGRGYWLSVRRLRHRPRIVHLRALGAGLGSIPRLSILRIRSSSFLR